MTRVHGKGGDTHGHVDEDALVAFRQLHFIPDPTAQPKQHLQYLVP